MDFMAPPSEAPPEDFFTAPMTTFTDEPEDEDEWEYEYSNTDTEVRLPLGHHVIVSCL
jgi:hypothetical protein